MPVTPPRSLTVSECASQIAEYIALWGDERGAITKVVANMRHLWEEVSSMSTDDSPRILVCFAGERSRGGEQFRNFLHRVDRDWIVVVMRGHGFDNRMVKADESDANDFYTVCETIRDRIRVLLSITEEFPVDYKAMRPLPGVAVPNSANIFLDAYQIEFSTANDIAGVVETAPGATEEG